MGEKRGAIQLKEEELSDDDFIDDAMDPEEAALNELLDAVSIVKQNISLQEELYGQICSLQSANSLITTQLQALQEHLDKLYTEVTHLMTQIPLLGEIQRMDSQTTQEYSEITSAMEVKSE